MVTVGELRALLGANPNLPDDAVVLAYRPEKPSRGAGLIQPKRATIEAVQAEANVSRFFDTAHATEEDTIVGRSYLSPKLALVLV